MSNLDRLFTALSDPTRRRILELVRVRARAVGEIAAVLPVTQPAVSQHLKVLLEAGLVEATPAGRRRIYALRRAGLGALRAWSDAMWSDALARFAASFEAETAPVRTEEER
jgi:DNA-binding transcriptional ArsR family regulator